MNLKYEISSMRAAIKFMLFLLCFFLLASCTPKKTIEKVNEEDIQPLISNNISNMQITSFVEDEYGYVWIGTNRGLNKYNGYDYHQYVNNVNDSTSISDNAIRTLFKDSQNRLWIATSNGVCMYNTEKDCFDRIPMYGRGLNALQIFENKEGRIFVNMSINLCEYNPAKKELFSVIDYDYKAYINTCHIDDQNRLWLVSPYYIKCYNNSFEHLFTLSPQYENAHEYYSYLHNNGDLWVFLDNHLSIIDTKTGGYKQVPPSINKHKILSKSAISCIYPYEKTGVLISTKTDGLFLFDDITQEITHQSEKDFPFDAPNNETIAIYSDSKGNLWMAPLDDGFFINYKYKQQFNINNSLRTITDKKAITSIAIDRKNNIWLVSPHNNELIVYNINKDHANIIDQKSFIHNEALRDKINTVFIDSNDNIWILIRDKAFLCTYVNGQITIKKQFSFPAVICSITQDYKGTIWIGGFSEYAYGLRIGTDNFEKLQLYPADYTFARSILRLSTNEILFSSFKQNLKLINPDTWEVREIDIRKALRRPKYIPTALFEDSDQNIWIGTRGNGLLCYSLKTKEVTSYRDLIPCDDIASITEDSKGNIWIGTFYGLNKLDKKTNNISSYYSYDGIGGNQFYENSVCALPDSSLIFGGTHGLTFFNPIKMIHKGKVPLYFEDLRIQNHLQVAGKSPNIGKSLILNPQINLGYKQGDISISYAAVDYNEYPQIRYYYKMEGFDNNWVEARYTRQANYSNLPAGSYTFKVKITSNDNDSILAENSIPVHVTQTVWLSWPAMLIYGVLIVAFIMYINLLYLRIRLNRSRAKIALQEKEHEIYVNKMNMNFFSNVSHEFRTPLTMISGPISTLCKDEEIKTESKLLLQIVNRSVNRMLRLVNQLMDFNKLENDTLKLQVSKMDVVHELKLILEIFAVNAKDKRISFNIYGLNNSYVMLLDRDKFEKITENLLSNALKYSTEGGQIDVRFDIIDFNEAKKIFPNIEINTSPEFIRVSVEDEGPGIPESKLCNIFNRYYQVDDNNETNKLGTGIGLYYAKRLTKLHHGYIKAENKVNKGCIFTFILPGQNQSYSSNEMEYSDINVKDMDSIPLDYSNDKHYTLLVVDDDPDISQYLNTLLSPIYNVVNKFDAHTAYAAIEEVAPDLIVSDVLMPGMDGYQFCQKIKENISFCHIPVVLLTAKALIEEQIQGLEVGANAYVNKPFEPSYLLAVIKSQLKNRDYIHNVVGNTTQVNDIEENLLSYQDKEFLNNLYELMEQELENPELNITSMTKKLGMSRAKLYYKIKGLTGLNPNLFFRTYKLNRASELLKEGKYNVSEVAILTGFSTLSHFSVSFKKQFNCSPSDYKG